MSAERGSTCRQSCLLGILVHFGSRRGALSLLVYEYSVPPGLVPVPVTGRHAQPSIACTSGLRRQAAEEALGNFVGCSRRAWLV